MSHSSPRKTKRIEKGAYTGRDRKRGQTTYQVISRQSNFSHGNRESGPGTSILVLRRHLHNESRTWQVQMIQWRDTMTVTPYYPNKSQEFENRKWHQLSSWRFENSIPWALRRWNHEGRKWRCHDFDPLFAPRHMAPRPKRIGSGANIDPKAKKHISHANHCIFANLLFHELCAHRQVVPCLVRIWQLLGKTPWTVLVMSDLFEHKTHSFE